jgi:transcriptional regulator with XRE-family HTH domain
MSQVALAELACISPALVSMVENGQRSLRSASHVLALADVLRVSPRYLADGWDDAGSAGQGTSRTTPFPARSGSRTLARHEQLARQFNQLARQDGRATGDWLRRLAREPTVNPWLLLDQIATTHACPGHHNGNEHHDWRTQ